MALRRSLRCLLLLSIAVIDAGQPLLGTQVSSYDNDRMLQLIAGVEGVAEQLSLAAATWGKLRADYPRDVPKIEAFSDTMAQLLCQPGKNVTLQQQLQAHLLSEQIRVHLATLNTTAIFARALQAAEHERGNWQRQIGGHSQQLHCLFKPAQVNQIGTAMLAKLYKLERGKELAALLYQLYLPGNRDSFELMARLELQLYERYKRGGQEQPQFGAYMAQLWQGIQQEPFYTSLEPAIKQRMLDAMISLLNYL